jgi:polyisoprenoid-binding protein YceI
MFTRKLLGSMALTTALFTLPALAETVPWLIDASHSHVGFTVSHMVVSEVDGKFNAFSGKVALDDKDLTKSTVEFTIEANSIDTANADRDKHLKNADFLDVEKFPKIEFKSKKITKSGKGYKLKGDLTLHGVTKEVTLDGTLSPAINSPWGKQVRGVKVTGKINRSDFGLTWNKTLDKGGLAVGNEVTFNIKLELNDK